MGKAQKQKPTGKGERSEHRRTGERKMAKLFVVSYKKYEDLREAYDMLLKDNQRLSVMNRDLQKKLANLEVKCRILEEGQNEENVSE